MEEKSLGMFLVRLPHFPEEFICELVDCGTKYRYSKPLYMQVHQAPGNKYQVEFLAVISPFARKGTNSFELSKVVEPILTLPGESMENSYRTATGSIVVPSLDLSAGVR